MFQNNSIVICSNDTKIKLLKDIDKLINIKFYTLNNFIKNLYFDYDEKSILYVIKKYNVKYEIALEYLNNLIYIEDKIYNIERLDFLVKLKKELFDNKLLILNTRFKKYLESKKIYIYDICLTKFDKYLLSGINYEIIDTKNNNYEQVIYEFNTIEEEVEYIAKSICKLISNGVDINRIKLTNVSNDYINIINKIFSFYNLKINKNINSPIYSNIVGSTFYKQLKYGLAPALESIKKYEHSDTYNRIINIINKYAWCTNLDDLKILLEYSLKKEYISEKQYTNSIEVVDLYEYPFTDEYVFLIGFNQGIIPKNFKDEDYISDKNKPYYIDTAVEKNILNKKYTLKCIKNIKNLVITYKLKTSFNTYYPSNLLDDLNIDINKVYDDYNTSYSKISDSIHLTEYLDNLIKFNEKNSNIEKLYSNYNIPYNTYKHIYTGIDKNKINNYIKSLREFNLSYTYIDDYNRCSFKFFIGKILNLKKDLNKMGIILGNLYHEVLKNAVKSDVDIDEEVNKFIQNINIELSNSNKFFIEKAKNNLKYIIDVIKEQNKYSKLNNVETEKYIKINLKDNINFVGFIDKIIYDTFNSSTIAVLIDYKTYVKKPSLKYLNNGIDIQLPVYMYLSKNEYKNVKFAGFYLQNIVLNNKSDEEKLKSLKLIGYSNKDTDILSKFDYNYAESKVIDGLKVKIDGSFTENSLKRIVTDDKIDEIINKTKQVINESLDNILNSRFDINPKYDNGNIGCEFCEFKDICYMKEFDFVKITSEDNESGGDEA